MLGYVIFHCSGVPLNKVGNTEYSEEKKSFTGCDDSKCYFLKSDWNGKVCNRYVLFSVFPPPLECFMDFATQFSVLLQICLQ